MYPNNGEAHPQASPAGPNQLSNGGIRGQWSTGLCDCFDDPGNCFVTWCCPCITFGQIAEILDAGATTCAIAGCIYYLLEIAGCSCLYSCTYRSKLRGIYSLQEDPCLDFCVHCCCRPCALCQEYRELKNHGVDPALGWQAIAAMRNQGGATMPPNVAPGMAR